MERESRSCKDSVQLYYSYLPLPIGSFALHTWLVTQRKNGVIHRWEVWAQKDCCKTSWGYLHRDLFPPFQGIGMLPSLLPGKWRWKSKLASIEEGEIAEKIIHFLETEYQKYPYKNQYHFFPGPNSNSYVSWVLQNFPSSRLEMPKRALGAEYLKIIDP